MSSCGCNTRIVTLPGAMADGVVNAGAYNSTTGNIEIVTSTGSTVLIDMSTIFDSLTPAQCALILDCLDFSGLDATDCQTIFQCILDNGTAAQFTELLQKFDFTQLTATQATAITNLINFTSLTPAQITQLTQVIDYTQLTAQQITDIQTALGPLMTVNAGTTAAAGDGANGTEDVTFGDVLHFWSSDGSVNVNVAPGSAIVDITSNVTGGTDTSGSVETATVAFTTTNGSPVAVGESYVLFPDNTTWATEKCTTVVGPFSHTGITGLNTDGDTSDEWSEFYVGAASVGFALTGTIAGGGGYVSLQVGSASGLSDIFDGAADGFNANDLSSAGAGGGNFAVPSAGTYFYRLIRSGSTNLGGTAQNVANLAINAVSIELTPCELITASQDEVTPKTINIECYDVEDYSFTFNRNDEPSVATTNLSQLESGIEFYAGPVAIPLEGVLVELTNNNVAAISVTATVEDLDSGSNVAAATLSILPGTAEYFFPFPGLLVGNNNAEGYDILWSGANLADVTLGQAAGDNQADGNFFALQGPNTPQVAWVSAINIFEARVVTCSDGSMSAYDASDNEIDISNGVPASWVACDPLPESAAGTETYVLTSNGPNAEPTWEPVAVSARAGGHAGFSNNDGGGAGTILTPDAGQVAIGNSAFSATFWAPAFGLGGVKVGTVYRAYIHGVATAGSAGTLAVVETGDAATRYGSITVDAATGNFSGEIWFTAANGSALAFIVDTGTVNIVAGQTFVTFEEMNG